MYTNAGTFDAKIYNYAYVDGTRWFGSPENPIPLNYNAFVNTGAGVGNWYVLSGTDVPVSLAVDIRFKAQFMRVTQRMTRLLLHFFPTAWGFSPPQQIWYRIISWHLEGQ